MQIKTYDNQIINIDIPANLTGNLLALPALIDCHVHFRVPGGEHKEDWRTGAKAAIAGGVTTVLDMPNNSPSVTTAELLEQKKKIIDAQLKEAGIPLRYRLYLGASVDNLDEIRKTRAVIAGIKMFMGASTGNLLVDKRADQEKIFALAGKLGLVVAVHAEDNDRIKNYESRIKEPTISDHSKIRYNDVAASAVEQAIEMSKKYGTQTYFLHCSTKEEVALIRQAKKNGVNVFAEVTPHHLFLNTSAYENLGTKAQMNPPLRSTEDQRALWEALNDGTIDTVGTDHAPHTLEEKNQPYPKSPSGVPGIETYLPLLLDACSKGQITIERLVEVTSTNPRKIFGLPENSDWVIVDQDLVKKVKNENLKTKCGWSPFDGWKLTGWPVATVLNGKVYCE